MEWSWFKIETFIPEAYLERLQAALNAVDALIIDGRYDTCMAVTPVTGYWRPLAGARPFLGKAG